MTINGHELTGQLHSLKIYQIVAKTNAHAKIKTWIEEAEKFKLDIMVRSSLDDTSPIRVSYDHHVFSLGRIYDLPGRALWLFFCLSYRMLEFFRA